MPRRDVPIQMIGHGFSVAGYQSKTICLDPKQNIRIGCTFRWRGIISDACHFDSGLAIAKLVGKSWVVFSSMRYRRIVILLHARSAVAGGVSNPEDAGQPKMDFVVACASPLRHFAAIAPDIAQSRAGYVDRR